MRADELLTKRGYFKSRTKAAEAIRRGLVETGGKICLRPAQDLSEDCEIRILAEQYVSNGGYKLKAAFEVFRPDVKEKICLDAGASTGGFTQVLLEEGAARVFAVDVGENLLDPSLREDPRVTALDKTNVRSLRAEDFPPLDFLTSDLSFISLRTVGQTLLSLLRPGGEAVLLIKPQFEAGKQFLNKNGIIKDPKVRTRIVGEISDFFRALGALGIRTAEAPLRKSGMNQEYLLYFRKGE